jgi:hypothetical protein
MLHPTLQPLLAALRDEVLALLGTDCVAIYIHGSVASGAFDPGHSDVDFVVVTANALPDTLLPALAAMHARLTASGLPMATVLEGSYIPRQALRCYDPLKSEHPALRVDGTVAIDGHGIDWVIQRHLIRERALVLHGPDPKTLIDPVSPGDLRQSARGILQEWWEPQLSNTSRLQSDEYQAYAILTMCRILYTISQGDVTSKPAAARWAQQRFGPAWASLINRALAWHHGERLDALPQTLDLIRYTLVLVSDIPEDRP